MKKAPFFLLFCLFILRGPLTPLTAQNIYQSIGKTTEVLTLSNGQYQEIFPNDTIVHIGSVLFNTVTHKIVAFVESNEEDSTVVLMETSRFLSIDPIGRKYPELTPYQFASNTPIQAIDLDGLEAALPGAQGFGDGVMRYFLKKRGYSDKSLDEWEAKRDKLRQMESMGTLTGAAFIFGGYTGVTAGTRILLAISTSQTVQSIVISSSVTVANYGPDIANFVYGIASNDVNEPFPSSNFGSADAGVAFRQLFKKGEVILDFFGGATSKYAKGLSIDPLASSGFKGTIGQFSEIFAGNKFKQIIADNPQGYMDYLKDAANLLEKGGTIAVRGTKSNPYFNQILKGKANGLESFDIIQNAIKISDELKATMKRTDGTDITGDIYEIILKRKE